MLLELNKPLSSASSSPAPADQLQEQPNCPLIRKEFSLFLAQTTKFLYAIQERQMRFAWKGDSLVVRELRWLQGLWASRRGNTQDRSFIEQQMELYKGTKCFTNMNREVLRKDVEVVEYLNDLIEMFW
ncbi:hypothetical protein CJF30_00005721 [Rutstroemia sp. NJR-2017a BBW]|nr:hypothetical protein CJF30_00005721 [Rutstroemia sp. NJR-2017a BBW]